MLCLAQFGSDLTESFEAGLAYLERSPVHAGAVPGSDRIPFRETTPGRVYVCPTDSDEWGDDLIEGDVLQNGGDIEIVFAPDEDIVLWDVMVEDEEGNALYWRRINLMTAEEIILEPDEVARIKEI